MSQTFRNAVIAGILWIPTAVVIVFSGGQILENQIALGSGRNALLFLVLAVIVFLAAGASYWLADLLSTRRSPVTTGNVRHMEIKRVWDDWESSRIGDELLTVKERDLKRRFEVCGPGVGVAPLHVDRENNQMTVLFRMEPGTAWPPHRHSDVEAAFVVEGDLHVGEEIVLRRGDYQRAGPGSHHHVQRTHGGCLLLVTCAMNDTDDRPSAKPLG